MNVLYYFSYEMNQWAPIAYGTEEEMNKQMETVNNIFESKKFKILYFDSDSITDILNMSSEDIEKIATVVTQNKTHNIILNKEPDELTEESAKEVVSASTDVTDNNIKNDSGEEDEEEIDFRFDEEDIV